MAELGVKIVSHMDSLKASRVHRSSTDPGDPEPGILDILGDVDSAEN